MFIQTEKTPNPNSLKFTPGQNITGGEPINFDNIENCENSNLAKELFSIKNIDNVFFGFDFITITKSNDIDWELLKPEILVTIMEYLLSEKPILNDRVYNEQNNSDDNGLIKQIRELIETRIRPAVAQDGGDITFVSFSDGIVKLKLHGSCSGCPSSTVTLKDGIENMLKHYIPEIISVESVN